MKWCNTCQSWKEESEFGVYKLAKDGLKSNCLECCRKATRDIEPRPDNYLESSLAVFFLCLSNGLDIASAHTIAGVKTREWQDEELQAEP